MEESKTQKIIDKKEELIKTKYKRRIKNYSRFLFNYFIKDGSYNRNEISSVKFRLGCVCTRKNESESYSLYSEIQWKNSVHLKNIKIEPIDFFKEDEYKKKKAIMMDILKEFFTVLYDHGFELYSNQVSINIIEFLRFNEVIFINKKNIQKKYLPKKIYKN